MKTKRIILLYEKGKCGRAKLEKPIGEKIILHLFDKEFDIPNGCFPFNKIEHIRGNLFRIDSVFGKDDYCFRPKWYQYHKIGLYYIVKLIPNILSWFGK